MPATPSTPAAEVPAPPPPAGHTLALAWVRANPLPATLAGTMLLTLAVFYAGVPLFFVPADKHFITAWQWIRSAWNPENHYEHGPLVPFIILFLIWNAIPKLRGLTPKPSAAGLALLAFGVLLYLISARALQPRFAWAALPFVLLGGVLYAAGKQAARVLLFPLVAIFFMIPVPDIDQATVKMQVMATAAARMACNLIGIKMISIGTSLRAVDDNFQFQVIGDCSGINSLMAITLMTAVFAHLTQDRLWKKLLLFAASAPVAIVGNFARLTAIMIMAKCFGQEVAGGWFHEASAYLVSFPFAFGSLCLVNKLLNWNAPAPVRPAHVNPARQPRRMSPRSPMLRSCRARLSAMIINRLLILQVMLALGLSVVFLLPTKTALGPAGIALTLPDNVGEWKGRDAAVSPVELAGLAPDTGFARRFYKDAAGNEMYVSIVLSGVDMANSIHRPERCLSAQGWTVERSDKVEIPVSGGSPLKVTKLSDEREVHPDATHTVALRNLNYYWFVGSHNITASHWTRTFIDVKDRILHGEAQRWAYITVATSVTDNLQPSGGLNATDSARLVEGFIAQIVPQFKKP